MNSYGAPCIALRIARGQAAQQRAIDTWAAMVGAQPAAVIAEGAFFELTAPQNIDVERIVAGCVCCVGLVPLRVTLTRLLRNRRPARILLLVGDDAHVERVRALLAGGELGVSFQFEEDR